MNVLIYPRRFSGEVSVPASKSHTIRRLLIATLAGGESALLNPLDSLDARACLDVCRALGAEITTGNGAGGERWLVKGVGGAGGLKAPAAPLDVKNSGTTLFLALAVAALAGFPVTFTGDEQIAGRGAGPLLDALAALGVKIRARAGGCVPITVRGPLNSGRVTLSCPTSQYLSALLLAAPLAPAGTIIEIDVPLLNERPYIEMTLSYLDAQGVKYETNREFSYFRLSGGASYRPVNAPVSGDFSSAAFPAAAAAISGGEVLLRNLDRNDTQGDKAFFDLLAKAGCGVRWEDDGAGGSLCRVTGQGKLRGVNFDLNATPDMLPVACVIGAFAEGETKLYNAAHARIKETDRIACMHNELSKLGVQCRELPDGLVIKGTAGAKFKAGGGITLDGHKDHRIVMALSVAALNADGPVVIEGAEAAAVTYPGFFDMINADDTRSARDWSGAERSGAARQRRGAEEWSESKTAQSPAPAERGMRTDVSPDMPSCISVSDISVSDIFTNAREVFKWLDNFVNLEAGVKPPSMRPERMEIIVRASGGPERCAPAIHIAGSKGKGTITAMVSAMLGRAGLRVGRYLSPHIADYRERITLDDDFFDERIYAAAGNRLFRIQKTLADKNGSFYRELLEVSDGEAEPTFFELLTLYFFLCAEEAGVDVLAVETGMGGRLDPTNISRSIVSVITGIELEHTDMLGDTISKIAFEKAGIIKPGVPLLLAAQEHRDAADALNVFRRTSSAKNAPLFYFPDIAELAGLKVDRNGTSWTLIDKSGQFFKEPLRLQIKIPGAIQAVNTSIAAFAVKKALPLLADAGVCVPDDAAVIRAIVGGAAAVTLPARFEKISESPLVIIDGAHTEISVRHTVETWTSLYGSDAVLLFGCAAGKDSASMALSLVPNFAGIIITMPGTYKPSEPDKVYDVFNNIANSGGASCNVQLIRNTEEALDRALTLAKESGQPLLVIGSFYLAAIVRQAA